jgi:hypothetical protein
MGLFSRSTSEAASLRDAETKAAEISRGHAATAASTGKSVRGIDAAGWTRRAETFQAAADDYQRQIDGE